MRRKNKAPIVAIAAFVLGLGLVLPSCVAPVPILIPVPESDIETIAFIPLIAARYGQTPCEILDEVAQHH